MCVWCETGAILAQAGSQDSCRRDPVHLVLCAGPAPKKRRAGDVNRVQAVRCSVKSVSA